MNAFLKQFFIFAAVGLCGTLIQYSVLFLGVELLAVNASISSGVGYMLGSIVNYLLNYFYTFKKTHGNKTHREAIGKYYLITGVGFFLNLGLMLLLTEYFKILYWFAQLLTTAIGLVWNFSGSRWWVFRHR